MRQEVCVWGKRISAVILAVSSNEMRCSWSRRNEGARKIYIKLAEEELGHKQTLERLVEEIQTELAGLKAKQTRSY
jgi:hypothetical protein